MKAPKMRRKAPNLPRRVWTEEEDELLRSIVHKHCNLTWNEIAKRIHSTNPMIEKSGKQCRERYRNYLNVSIINKPWTKDEKMLFILLHSTYGNHWREISKFFSERNDLSMKNFFYSYLRKILKRTRNKPKIFHKPLRLLEYYYIIDLVLTKYIPRLQEKQSPASRINQDMTILNVIRASGLDERILLRFKNRLIQKFQGKHSPESLPLVLFLDSESFHWDYSCQKTISDIIKKQKLGDLSQLLRIQVTTEDLRDEPLNNSEPCFNLSNHVEKSIDIMPQSSLAPKCNSYETPSRPLIALPFHSPTPLLLTSANHNSEGLRELDNSNKRFTENSSARPIILLPELHSTLPLISVNPTVYIYPQYSFDGFYADPLTRCIQESVKSVDWQEEKKKLLDIKRISFLVKAEGLEHNERSSKSKEDK